MKTSYEIAKELINKKIEKIEKEEREQKKMLSDLKRGELYGLYYARGLIEGMEEYDKTR